MFITSNFQKVIARKNVSTGDTLWTPSQITTLGLWEPDDSDSITEALGEVSQLDDKSSDGTNHLTQTIASRQPTTNVRTLGAASFNVLDCDGGDEMDASDFPVPSSGDIAVIGVFECDVVNNSNQAIFSLAGGSTNFQYDAANTSYFRGVVDITNNSNVVNSDTSRNAAGIHANILDFTAAIPLIKTRYNGTELNTGSYTTKLSTVGMDFMVMVSRSGTSFIDGAFGRTVVTEDVTTATTEKIEGWLAWTYDNGDIAPGSMTAGTFVGLLPVGHTYKTSPPTV